MRPITPYACVLRVLVPAVVLASGAFAQAQQTLGAIQGTITDPSGALVVGAQVQLSGDVNGVKLTAKSQKNGVYQFQNLPVGTYTLTFTGAGFETSKVPSIPVQENRTGTINIALKTGSASDTVEVLEQPLLNETDATNGYVLDARQIQEAPLATGSFTRLATLSPGINGELLAGIGTDAGLGNQPLWANGQRDTSNGIQIDGVDATNLFNGKTSSQDQSQVYNFNIGQGSAVAGQSQTNTSVYGSNGNGLATPPPEFIQELRVNTSQYDAAQGNRSGAQIDVNTATGNNQYHGQLTGTRATNFINAAPYFNKQGVLYLNNLPYSFLVPQLHRDTAGATFGGPLIKDKLFFFLGYENTHDADALKGYSAITVPYVTSSTVNQNTASAACVTESKSFTGPEGLTDDRSAAGIAKALDAYNQATCNAGGTQTTFTGAQDSVATALLNAKLTNGQYLIPSVQNTTLNANTGTNVFLNESSVFRADSATAALDYNVTSNDRVSAKYYYQHDPDVSPFTNANTAGYPATEDSGAQVAALSNTITIGSKVNWEQRVGISRQKVYSTFKSILQGGDSNFGIGFVNPQGLPGLSLGKFAYASGSAVTVGPNSTFANAGYFQNRINPESNVIFTIGKHNLAAGGSYNFTQLNIRNRRANLGSASTTSFVTFVEGQVSSSNELLGNANRYYRANELGFFVQDQYRLLPNLSVTAGVRYDYDGGFSEKYGNIFNFSPALYAQNGVGFVVAGNNAYAATPGTNNTTLTGRQWGISPRLGFAFTPANNGGKVVIHGSFGMYYDRGEYFSYLSQPAGSSTGGPFGATEAAPLANYVTGAGTRTLENPLGSAAIPTSSSNPNSFAAKIYTISQIKAGCGGLAVEEGGGDCGVQPYNFGAYAQNNKLPYTIDYSLGMQFQLTNSIAATLGYVGNVGKHGVIPVPFNEPGIATPTNPINGETSSYGYEVLNTATPVTAGGKTYFTPISTEPYNTYDGGNVDLRVPYVGYSPNAALFEAVGVSAYNALQAHIEKRLANHTSFGASYTFSHALDEQSDIGLFFTGDNPNQLHDSYAKADFDRTNVLVFNFVVGIPDLKQGNSLVRGLTNGWQLVGLATFQSGQPYSLYEYDGAVGSLYFGNYPTLANPVLGIKDGAHPYSALTRNQGSQLNISGTSVNSSTPYLPLIDNNQLAVNLLQPGQKGIPNCTAGEPCDYFETDFTPGQRNIFRQSFQKDADISFQKITKLGERLAARYTFDVFNITNSTSFDKPNNSASISQSELNQGGGNIGYGQVDTSVATNQSDINKLYVIRPNGATTFGAIRNTIGQPRTIEMSLHLTF